MLRLTFLSAVFIFISGCASSIIPAALKEPFFLGITRGHTAIGGGAVWVVENGVLTITYMGVRQFTRKLSRDEEAALSESVQRSGLRSKYGQNIVVPLPPGQLALSDTNFFVFFFTNQRGEEGRAKSVTFWNDVDDGSRKVIEAVDALLPPDFRIDRR